MCLCCESVLQNVQIPKNAPATTRLLLRLLSGCARNARASPLTCLAAMCKRRGEPGCAPGSAAVLQPAACPRNSLPELCCSPRQRVGPELCLSWAGVRLLGAGAGHGSIFSAEISEEKKNKKPFYFISFPEKKQSPVLTCSTFQVGELAFVKAARARQ